MSVEKSNNFKESGYSENIDRARDYRMKFERKYTNVLACQTNLSSITEEMKGFYKSVVILEAACIEDSENMGYSFPLNVIMYGDNNIVVKCSTCGKEYNLKDAEKLIKERDEFLTK